MTATNLARSAHPAAAAPNGLECVVVDDSVIDRYLICHALRGALPDAQIHECATAEDAEKALMSGRADVVLADRILPDGDGAQVALSAKEGAAVVVLSGEDARDLEKLLGQREGAAFLHKDDLSSEALGALLARLTTQTSEVVPLRPHAGSFPPVPGVDVGVVSRGLRALRTVRAGGANIGREEIGELLADVERILVRLQTGPRGGAH